MYCGVKDGRHQAYYTFSSGFKIWLALLLCHVGGLRVREARKGNLLSFVLILT